MEEYTLKGYRQDNEYAFLELDGIVVSMPIDGCVGDLEEIASKGDPVSLEESDDGKVKSVYLKDKLVYPQPE